MFTTSVTSPIGCRLKLLYAAIKNGDLRARKHGRATIILADDLQAFLKALPAVQVQPKQPDNDC